MARFVPTLFIVILFGDLSLFNMIDGAFLKYFGIPVAFIWFVSQKTFDVKKPFGFLKSAVTFALCPKVTYAGKAIKLKNEKRFKIDDKNTIYLPRQYSNRPLKCGILLDFAKHSRHLYY